MTPFKMNFVQIIVLFILMHGLDIKYLKVLGLLIFIANPNADILLLKIIVFEFHS